MDGKKLTARDYASDQDLRWCPGCGDFAILKQTQMVLAEIQADPAQTVFISGIGCSSRFPYYMNTYGMHSIHGRATAIASGLRLSRPDLNIWVITGDGDSMSIGGNHLIHLLRRDLNLNVLLFNNEIYGLTKGQYSPTSKQNIRTKSSPFGSVEKPFNTLSLAFGAGASFIARSIDREAKHLQEMLKRTNEHEGTSLLEIYQNCHIFNDGAFEPFSDRKAQKLNAIFLRQDEVISFGENNEKAFRFDGLSPRVVDKANYPAEELWIHDESDALKASILCNWVESNPELPKLFGVIYAKKQSNSARNMDSDVLDERYVNDLIKGRKTWSV
ncbi:2-oxoacid:ferredoxin oxidoreductase subunit beta [Chitinophagales bacterium]|nr:2-oxoacid:ferredoxin oxidoreductase subunit beta [Chitinophagales bacterium]